MKECQFVVRSPNLVIRCSTAAETVKFIWQQIYSCYATSALGKDSSILLRPNTPLVERRLRVGATIRVVRNSE